MAIALLTRNYTFFLVIFLAGLVLILRLRRVPPDVHFAIREEGVQVGSRFFGWHELKDFWIIYRPPEVKKVYLHFKSSLRPALDISLENENPLKVRQFLGEHLLENTELEDEPIADQLSRYFKL